MSILQEVAERLDSRLNGEPKPTEQSKTFTQAEVDAIVESRLARERAKSGDDPVSQRLEKEASQRDEDAVAFERLKNTFGNVPGAGKRAMEWSKSDPKGYREARERYQVLAGIKPRPRPQSEPDSSKLHPGGDRPRLNHI
jgi:hypothetical protein